MAEKAKTEAASLNPVARVWDAITRDGTLAAFGRQGADEIAQALRAFPETIHSDQPGTILNPTQGEIAASRETKLPSPSEIARDKQPYRPEPGQDHDNGRER
jgi:hypothetical protein